ncbi:MAG: hypothetical protein JSV41_06555 [Gemmatimonadota bacterium]|nr:MAG: hypothetical protein JSV41_06555 [Gemmatimonadota bacterium]
MARRLCLAVCLLFLSCEDATAPAGAEVPLDSEFNLALGETVTVSGTGLSIRFAGVPEDSRCPPVWYCFWAGNARIELEVSGWLAVRDWRPGIKLGGGPVSLNTNTSIGPSAVRVGCYELRLISLAPESAPQVPGDYEATLRVVRD